MSDPAVQATIRGDAIAQRGEVGIYLNLESPLTREHVTAREALRPIRDWSAKWSVELLRRDLGEAWDELAPLIFASDELTR